MDENKRAEILEQYKEYLNRKGTYQPSTINLYLYVASSVLKNIPELDNIEYYNQYLVDKSIKKRNYHTYFAIKKFINFYIDDKKKANRMVKALIFPKIFTPERHRKYLTYQERKKIIEDMREWKHRLMAKIQFYTGARIGEILRLQKGDITYESFYDEPDKEKVVMLLMITQKGGQKKPIWIMNKDLQEDIDLYTLTQPSDYKYYFVYRSNRYKNITDDIVKINTNYHWYWQDLKDSLLKNGYSFKDWSTHDFRRNIAQDIWMATKDPIIVQRMLRHKRIDTTLRYISNAGLQTQDISYNIEKIYSNDIKE